MLEHAPQTLERLIKLIHFRHNSAQKAYLNVAVAIQSDIFTPKISSFPLDIVYIFVALSIWVFQHATQRYKDTFHAIASQKVEEGKISYH